MEERACWPMSGQSVPCGFATHLAAHLHREFITSSPLALPFPSTPIPWIASIHVSWTLSSMLLGPVSSSIHQVGVEGGAIIHPAHAIT